MRRVILRPSPKSVQFINYFVQIQAQQCRAVALYMSAFMKNVVRPRLRIGAKRRRSGALLSSMLLNFRYRLSVLRPSIDSHLGCSRAWYEQSFYWLHSADPYTI